MLKILGLDSKVGVYLRDGGFPANSINFNLYPSKGTHSVCYNGDFLYSYGCPTPKIILCFIKNRHGKFDYFECQIQKHDSFWASYLAYMNYFTINLTMDFESAVLSLYCQMIQDISLN